MPFLTCTASSSSSSSLLSVLLLFLFQSSLESSASETTMPSLDIPAIQVEALKGCDQSGPLGMISGDIQDWQVSASSTSPPEWDKGCHERFARLYQPNGRSWCAKYKSPSEWLQIDLGVAAKITGLMTQGRGDGQSWVTSFMVSYSLDALDWEYVSDIYGNQRVFEGNSDSDTVKHSYLEEPIIARFIRFQTVHWSHHPSMRVEILGCQPCREPLALPPYTKVTASSEKISNKSSLLSPSSCHAEDGFIVTNKAWCARTDDDEQWLQFDIGPPTLVTGMLTRGRGDGGRKHWVTRFRLSYSNDSREWTSYKDAERFQIKRQLASSSSLTLAGHGAGGYGSRRSVTSSDSNRDSDLRGQSHMTSEALEFGGNVDKDIERVHYFNSPFVARFIRFHPLDWNRHISMRAGLYGCPYTGTCGPGFMRINDYTPCVANLALRKESFVSNRRQFKRHVRNQWTHGQAARAVDGDTDSTLHSCTLLDNFYVEKPVWMVDLGTKVKVSGVVVVTWQGQVDGQTSPRLQASRFNNSTSNSDNRVTSYGDYTHNLDRLTVYVDNKAGMEPIDSPGKMCGFVSRLNGALFRPQLYVQCVRPLHGRYVYIEASGVAQRRTRLFSAVLCEVMVYE